MRGTKFLWNKFFFFLFIGVGLFTLGFYVHPVQRLAAVVDNLTISADEPVSTASSTKSNTYNMVIDVEENGSLMVDGKLSTTDVKPSGEYDELRYVVFNGAQKTPEGYYDNLNITVNLPTNINQQEIPLTQRRLITAHGVGETSDSVFSGNKTILFGATDIATTANVTVLINFPKGYLSLGGAEEAQRAVQSVPGNIWLVLSIGLPLISLVIMLTIYLRTTGESLSHPPTHIVNSPPDNLSPAIVGVLTHGRIRSKELLAMIVDLSNRGFLGVEDRDGELMVYKKNIRSDVWGMLRPFEQTLITELFGGGKTLNTASAIKERVGRDLFSRRVAKIYKQLYADVSGLGFFARNPAITHWRNRIVGIAMFLLGCGGFMYSIIMSPDPKFTLFFWATMIAISLLTIFFATRISTRTNRGREELIKWLAFRNYLTLGRSVDLEDAQIDNEFEKYLPYAIALDVELEWAGRFSKVDFHLPVWYGAADRILDVQGFANSFFPLLGNFTEKLSFIKEPVVE